MDYNYRYNYSETVWIDSLTDTLVVSMLNWVFSLENRDYAYYNLGLPVQFDWLFFAVVVTRCLEEFFDHALIGKLPAYQPTCGMNYPDFAEARWENREFVQSGFAKMFTDVIRQESQQDALPFDVTFACEYVAHVIENNQGEGIKDSTLEHLRKAKGQTAKSFAQMLDDDDNIWG